MSIVSRLSYSQNRKDQGPNKVLAQDIIDRADQDGILQLFALLASKETHKELRKDASLTIAWVAERAPYLIERYAAELVSFLHDTTNRVIWGSMMALCAIAELKKPFLFENLSVIIDAMDAGTVVTRDHGYRILVTLYQDEHYAPDVILLIKEQLLLAPSNQLGQYAERMLPVIQPAHKPLLISTLETRREDVKNPHHLKRLNKNLKKLWN